MLRNRWPIDVYFTESQIHLVLADQGKPCYLTKQLSDNPYIALHRLQICENEIMIIGRFYNRKTIDSKLQALSVIMWGSNCHWSVVMNPVIISLVVIEIRAENRVLGTEMLTKSTSGWETCTCQCTNEYLFWPESNIKYYSS